MNGNFFVQVLFSNSIRFNFDNIFAKLYESDVPVVKLITWVFLPFLLHDEIIVKKL